LERRLNIPSDGAKTGHQEIAVEWLRKNRDDAIGIVGCLVAGLLVENFYGSWSLSLAVTGALAGSIAAFLWYQASKSKFTLVGIMKEGGPLEALNDLAQWTFDIKDQIVLSNRSNSRAALWTAGSVILNALATVIGLFSGGH
jgi:hypothetical protein